MNWNIFKRANVLEVRILIAESNIKQLHRDLNTAMLRVQHLENSVPKSLSEDEIKKRLKAAAYSRNYYKNKKAVAAARDSQ